ncbi:MAG: hypothetical protein OHK0038_14290 [Flammeovirgaceae bacterium]
MISGMKKLLIFCILLLKISYIASAQTVENVRAELDKVNRRINITYDLIAKGNNEDKYNIEVWLSLDSGLSFPQRLEFVTGKVGKGISAGVNKEIQWLYMKENPGFTGKNVAFKIRAKIDQQARKERLLALDGASACWRSAIFPGWGDYRVRATKKNYWAIGATSYALIGSGLYFRYSANQNYDKYKTANSLSDADNYFDKAKQQQRTYNALLAAGAAIWITDIVGVILKGAKNKKQQREIFRKEQEQNTSFRMNYNPQYQSFGLSLTKKF